MTSGGLRCAPSQAARQCAACMCAGGRAAAGACRERLCRERLSADNNLGNAYRQAKRGSEWGPRVEPLLPAARPPAPRQPGHAVTKTSGQTAGDDAGRAPQARSIMASGAADEGPAAAGSGLTGGGGAGSGEAGGARRSHRERKRRRLGAGLTAWG
jgi:hypothetical protein